MNTVKPYTYFSQIYSHLMESVDYSFWAKYIKEIHKTIGNKNDIALEIASGNCSLAKKLRRHFSGLYVTDLSLDMLKLKQKKIKAVCCDMVNLPFKFQFDFIFSAFDSINYLDNEEKLKLFFKNISQNLTPNGYLIFDVSLQRNSVKYVKKLNRKGKYNGIEYKQISKFDKENGIHTNIVEIKLKDGTTFNEIHNQKIYDFYYYFDVIDSANLLVSECFDAFTFENASADSERVQFIVRRKI